MPENDLQTIFDQVLLQMQDLPEKQQQILKASLDLFAEKGFDKTSTAKIAAKAHVAQGTVYRRFKSKQDLLAAVLTPILTEVFPRAVQEFAGQNLNRDYDDLEQLLNIVVLDRLTFIQANHKVLKIIFTQVLTDPQMLALLKEKFIDTIIVQAEKPIRILQAKKQLVDWPAHRILSLIAASIFTVAIRMMLFPSSKIDLASETRYLVIFLSKALSNS